MSCLGLGYGREASYVEYVAMLSTHEEYHGGRRHVVPTYDGLASYVNICKGHGGDYPFAPPRCVKVR